MSSTTTTLANVLYEKRGAIAYVTVNRPKVLNALNTATWKDLRSAEAILKMIASNAPIAVKQSLEAVNKGLDTSQSEGFALEASYFGLCAGTEDKKEGTSAFLEKRAPQFHGR